MGAKAWINVPPPRKQWLVRRAPSHIAAHGHRAYRASVIALPPAGHAKALRPPALKKIVSSQLDGGFIRFRAAGTEINAASAAHVFRRQSKQACGKFFCGGTMKLRAVRKAKLRSLLGHGTGDRSHAMPDVYNCGLPCGVQIFFAVGSGNPAAFAGVR